MRELVDVAWRIQRHRNALLIENEQLRERIEAMVTQKTLGKSVDTRDMTAAFDRWWAEFGARQLELGLRQMEAPMTLKDMVRCGFWGGMQTEREQREGVEISN